MRSLLRQLRHASIEGVRVAGRVTYLSSSRIRKGHCVADCGSTQQRYAVSLSRRV